MDILVWSQSVAVNRLRDWTSVHDLSQFASRDWLNDSNLNVMLDVLYEQIRFADAAIKANAGAGLAESPKTVGFLCYVRVVVGPWAEAQKPLVRDRTDIIDVNAAPAKAEQDLDATWDWYSHPLALEPDTICTRILVTSSKTIIETT
ncbi:hypothetical protein BS17DRAFT_765566 [Gyrodon lividus]|nr:hypothetical protein BS17DRAFT_765566 [Gyrodon lividus]